MVDIAGVGVSRGGYPNAKSYQVSAPVGLVRNRTLRKGKIYSVRKKAAFDGTVQAMPGTPQETTFRIPARPEIITTLSKEFQFNPPDLYMSLGMSPLDPNYSAQEGGSTTGLQLGVATTGVDLFFDRTIETNKTWDITGQGATTQWSRLGVAKDILDIYAIVRGDEALLKAQSAYSLSELSSELTDLVASGNVIQTGMVAIQYSDDFILYGLVTGMNFRFVKFNHRLIPTMGHVKLDLDIHNAGNSALVQNQFIGGASTGGSTSGGFGGASASGDRGGVGGGVSGSGGVVPNPSPSPTNWNDNGLPI